MLHDARAAALSWSDKKIYKLWGNSSEQLRLNERVEQLKQRGYFFGFQRGQKIVRFATAVTHKGPVFFGPFLSFGGGSATFSQDYTRDDAERAFATSTAFSDSIRIAATGPYRDDYIDGLIKFPNLSACLEPGVTFSAATPLHWMEIKTRAELTLCGFWLLQELGSLEKMRNWADVQGFPTRIRERTDGNARVGSIRIPIVNVPDLQVGKRSFFSFLRRNDSFVGTWVASIDTDGAFHNFGFELPTAE